MALPGTGDVIRISGKEKNSKGFINSHILPAVCALLNSDGGTIEIIEIKLDVRSIEQVIKNMIGGTALSRYVKVKQADDKILVVVGNRGAQNCNAHLITVNYNFFLPTEKQIISVETTDRMKEIRRVLGGISEDPVIQGSHLNNFIFGQASGLAETAVVQLKDLKAKASNNARSNTFAKRMLADGNKFFYYISGFANHRGGHIYYGINDKGVVTGEELKEEDKQEVIQSVTKTMERLIWTESRISPQRGVNWEIYFENIQGKEGEKAYVVVVFVAACPGGVFTAEPESYYIKKGKVERMDYDMWWKSFKDGKFSRYFIKPSNMDSVPWSSEDNKNFFINLSETLVDHRDAGDFDSFNKLCNMVIKNFKHKNAELVVMAGRVTIAYKSGNVELAKTLLQEFDDLLSSSKDRSIFEVRLCLSRCLVARSVGNYEESYEKSKEGLQLGQNIPPGLCLLWLFLECAMNAACLAFQNQHEVERFREMKKEALLYLEEAAKVASALNDDEIPYRRNDFQHKLSIYKVWVLINYSVTGDAAEIASSKEDLEAASAELSTVYKNELRRNFLTEFRRVEYNLAQSDYLTRLAETIQDKMEQKRILQDAMQEVSKAIPKAEINNYTKLSDYGKKRNKVLEERIKLCNVTECNKTTARTFEGFEY